MVIIIRKVFFCRICWKKCSQKSVKSRKNWKGLFFNRYRVLCLFFLCSRICTVCRCIGRKSNFFVICFQEITKSRCSRHIQWFNSTIKIFYKYLSSQNFLFVCGWNLDIFWTSGLILGLTRVRRVWLSIVAHLLITRVLLALTVTSFGSVIAPAGAAQWKKTLEFSLKIHKIFKLCPISCS